MNPFQFISYPLQQINQDKENSLMLCNCLIFEVCIGLQKAVYHKRLSTKLSEKVCVFSKSAIG